MLLTILSHIWVTVVLITVVIGAAMLVTMGERITPTSRRLRVGLLRIIYCCLGVTAFFVIVILTVFAFEKVFGGPLL